MLKIIRSCKDMNFQQLKNVYAQSCRERGIQDYPDASPAQQMLMAEQDLYAETECFFRDKQAFYAVWELDGRYVSVLRLEPYKDGLLLEGLETLPEERKKGYAIELVASVFSHLNGQTVYSHIHRNNTASLALHWHFGFETIQDYAVYADGSVSHKAYTMVKKV